ADRVAARALLREVLPGRNPVPGFRHRSSVHVPVGGPVHAAVEESGRRGERLRLCRDADLRRDPGGRARLRLEKEGDRMGVELTTTRLEDAAKWAKQSKLERVTNWGRKFS